MQTSVVLSQIFFITGAFFIKRSPNRHEHFLYWASLLHITVPYKKKHFMHETCPTSRGKQDAQNAKGLELAGHPACHPSATPRAHHDPISTLHRTPSTDSSPSITSSAHPLSSAFLSSPISTPLSVCLSLLTTSSWCCSSCKVCSRSQ